jgi:hypothetical protein
MDITLEKVAQVNGTPASIIKAIKLTFPDTLLMGEYVVVPRKSINEFLQKYTKNPLVYSKVIGGDLFEYLVDTLREIRVINNPYEHINKIFFKIS